jgi:hypothetical protein
MTMRYGYDIKFFVTGHNNQVEWGLQLLAQLSVPHLDPVGLKLRIERFTKILTLDLPGMKLKNGF